jgi:hypothetical protein
MPGGMPTPVKLLTGAGMPHFTGLGRFPEFNTSINREFIMFGIIVPLIQHNVHFIFVCLQNSTAFDSEYAVQSTQKRANNIFGFTSERIDKYA